MVKIDEVRLMLFSAIEGLAKEKGFKQNKYPQGGGLLRISKSITDTIGWGMLDYGERKQFLGFSAWNCHNEVREITLPVLINHKLVGSGSKIKNWSYTFYPKEGIPIKSMNDFEFKKLEDIEFIKEIYIDFFLNEALPYYEKWNSVLKVYDYVKDIENDRETGLGQFPVYEKAVIMRLCNDKRYKEYFYNYYLQKEDYYKATPDENDTIVYLNAAKEMMGILDEIKPKYNL